MGLKVFWVKSFPVLGGRNSSGTGGGSRYTVITHFSPIDGSTALVSVGPLCTEHHPWAWSWLPSPRRLCLSVLISKRHLNKGWWWHWGSWMRAEHGVQLFSHGLFPFTLNSTKGTGSPPLLTTRTGPLCRSLLSSLSLSRRVYVIRPELAQYHRC